MLHQRGKPIQREISALEALLSSHRSDRSRSTRVIRICPASNSSLLSLKLSAVD